MGRIELYKVKGTGNPADLGTKYLSATAMKEIEKDMPIEYRKGRADKHLELKSGTSWPQEVLRADACDWNNFSMLIAISAK